MESGESVCYVQYVITKMSGAAVDYSVITSQDSIDAIAELVYNSVVDGSFSGKNVAVISELDGAIYAVAFCKLAQNKGNQIASLYGKQK